MSTGMRFVFDRFELDPVRRRLTASGEPVAMSDRQLDVLLLLVARAGQIVAKDDLLQAGWQDVAVGDNSLEQVISSLRRLLGASPSGVAYIETVARRGYRFGVAVTQRASRESDTALAALLAPYRAFVEGRAALETLEVEQIARAREVFSDALQRIPEHASAHVGLSNACVLQFERTRADPVPKIDALKLATHHAREACRLDPQFAEAWATLGFVLARTGDRLEALATLKRAVTLEPDNWQHQVRLASVSWGEARLRAARRTLALLPDFPLAHWLAATVHVARQVFDEAERELTTALASLASPVRSDARFSAVALHWLLGLLCLARGDETRAVEEFERELDLEDLGHVYARECCANTWYALGALRWRQGRREEARTAFEHALTRIAQHPMARIGLMAVDASPSAVVEPGAGSQVQAETRPVQAALVRAAQLAVEGSDTEAARLIRHALTDAPAGDAAWVLPVEPLLHVTAHLDLWAQPLALLRDRAA